VEFPGENPKAERHGKKQSVLAALLLFMAVLSVA